MSGRANMECSVRAGMGEMDMGLPCVLKAGVEKVRLRRVLRQQSENRQCGRSWEVPESLK
jgi:hypothetical protein